MSLQEIDIKKGIRQDSNRQHLSRNGKLLLGIIFFFFLISEIR